MSQPESYNPERSLAEGGRSRRERNMAEGQDLGPERYPAEPSVGGDSHPHLQILLAQQQTLHRGFRSAGSDAVRTLIKEQSEQNRQAIDTLMTEASNNGMLAGLDLELDDILRRVVSHHHPSMRREELRRVRLEFKAEFSELTNRFRDEYPEKGVEKYSGAQQFYLETGLGTIERIANGQEVEALPEGGWEWTQKEFRSRALEDELAARRNEEAYKKEQKNQDRTVTIEEFVGLKNLIDSKTEIERYIQARYQTGVSSYPESQQAYIRQTIQTRIQNASPKLRQIGDEAWKNFQMAPILQAYANARQDLENIGQKPADQRASIYQAAQLTIAQTPEDQTRIADEILLRIGKISSTPEDFIETILQREGTRLFRLATKVIMQEEKIGGDSRNYLQLHEAYNYIEKIMPEALYNSVLEGMSYQMNNLYKNYRQKIIDGTIQLDYRVDLEQLRDKIMAGEKGWWDDHMRDRDFTEKFRDQFEGARAFYAYRAFQRFLQLIERKGDEVPITERQQEFIKLLNSKDDTIEQRQIELSDQLNNQLNELQQLLDTQQISNQQYTDTVLGLQNQYLKGLDGLREKRLVAGEWTPANAEQAMQREKREEEVRKLEGNTFWDRHWGTVILTGENPEQVRRGIDNFLEVATSDESNFDPQRYIEDGTRLGQEIQRVGRNVGMEQGEILELVARAEGTLFINVARYFATHWHVNEWHQVASLVGRHINTRLNAVSKAYKAEVMHAAFILDNEDEYDKYGRPARFASDLSSTDNEAAANERAKTVRNLEVRIALSELKSIGEVIEDHFKDIEDKIDLLGFNRNTAGLTNDQRDRKLIKLFKSTTYEAEITRISGKLKEYNKKCSENSPDKTSYKLEEWEKKLLNLDRIKPIIDFNRPEPYWKVEDLVLIDQTDQQFRSLYKEYGGCGTKEAYDAKVQRLEQKRANELTSDEERFLHREELLEKVGKGEKLSDAENRLFPEIPRAKQAIDLAIKTRDVFFISAEKACASLKTNHNEGVNTGELLSYNDVVRFNKFVRERAIASLPKDKAKIITGPRYTIDSDGKAKEDYAGLFYVDIADKLEFKAIAEKTVSDKKSNSDLGKNALEAIKLITLTTEEQQYADYVQAVEDVQEKALEKLKEKGSDLTVSDIDGVIEQVFKADGKLKIRIDYQSGEQSRQEHLQRAHKTETQPRTAAGYSYKDIINREDADPQYNFSMMDDPKYRSLLLSDENKAAAYNQDHPYYYTIPAAALRALEPDGTKLEHKTDPILEKVNTYRVMETQRRFTFAVDSPKVFSAFYQPDLYDSSKEVKSDIVVNITNSPFIARRMIEQRVWTTWERGQAYRGRGFLKYLESNFRGLDHSVGRRGLRGVIASYTGYNPKGFDREINFSGVLDELKAELWLGQAKDADAIRPILVGGQVGQDPNFEGIFKKIIKTIGRNTPTRVQAEGGTKSQRPPLWLIADGDWDLLKEGDYEHVIDEIEDRYKRITIYGNSLGYVGNTSHVPLAAKFTADTAARRLIYWSVAHPESIQMNGVNMYLIRAIMQPLKGNDKKALSNYFGDYSKGGGTLLAELLRRAFLVK